LLEEARQVAVSPAGATVHEADAQLTGSGRLPGALDLGGEPPDHMTNGNARADDSGFG
jgi:hypothetical protein